MIFISQVFSFICGPRFAMLGALVGLGALLVSCGGGDDNGDAAMTKAEFIKRADKICEKTDQTQKALLKTFLAERSKVPVDKALKEEVVTVVGLPPIQTETKELDALTPPEGDEDEIQKFIDGIDDAVETGEDDPGVLVSEGSTGPFAVVAKLAREYGFNACEFPL